MVLFQRWKQQYESDMVAVKLSVSSLALELRNLRGGVSDRER